MARKPGYDGAYGVIQLLSPAEREVFRGQVSLFGAEAPRQAKSAKGQVSKSARGSRAKSAAPAGELNGEQKAAVTATEPTVAVIAGPGTGKTHTLVERAAWLVEERKAKPAEITAITFTNRAAEELRARLEKRLGKRAARAMTIGTFHAVCLELLGDVPLADPYEQRAAAAAALEELGRKGSPAALLRAVSRWKTGMDTQEDPAFALYQEKLEGKLDFDDLLRQTLEQWRAGHTDKRFTHLLVDEFQDVDRLQLALLLAWRREGGTLFAIGDPDQSIYGFRGADPACFAALEGAHTVTLRQNYRSTPEILAAALPVAEAVDGRARPLEAVRPQGQAVRLVTAPGDRAEAIFVAKEIARMVGGMGMVEAQEMGAARGARSFGDIAVLCRTRRQHPAAAGPAGGVPGPGRHPLRGGGPGGLFAGRGGAAGPGLAGGPERGGHAPGNAAGTVDGPLCPLRRGGAAAQHGGVFRAQRRLPPQSHHRAGGGHPPPGGGELRRRGGDPLHPPRRQGPGVAGGVPLRRGGGAHSPGAARHRGHVGMTRARDELVLTTGGTPSRFLEGLPLQKEEARPASPRPQGVQMSLF